ncbi:hypothetical protein BN971_00636 [Mycobacterium bohemicum DSM 44277]|uniref:Uncharacterized protein n=1 Tax=Mycobacterium bohemicum DSM 44277 TaxID=1236609 RepID=A0A0U0W4R4_MYCBE|nr:hypothetical protein BN971_00636 [Mycobacterium bohemicum DSM 44277]
MQSRPRGRVVDRYRRPLFEAQRVGKRHGIGGRHVHDLGVTAESGARQDPLADARRVDAGADGRDGAGDFVAHHRGQFRRVGVEADAGQVVGEVDARGAHGDL